MGSPSPTGCRRRIGFGGCRAGGVFAGFRRAEDAELRWGDFGVHLVPVCLPPPARLPRTRSIGSARLITRRGDYDQAAAAFRAVGERWPNSRKSPDALLKLGFSQLEMKRYTEARVTLSDVTRRFPDSDAAKLAAERLRRIPADAR
ncbi:MAG: tetratricopeptide repeat protein [Gammaproteobacteria bacterium]